MKVSKEFTDSAFELFKGKNFAFVGSVMSDGSPQVTPVWVDFDGQYILVNTAEGRTKHRNLTRDPRVAVSVIDSQNPYNMVTVKGKVVEQTTSGADEHIDKLTKKYLGIEKYPYRNPEEIRIILKIKPEKIYHMY